MDLAYSNQCRPNMTHKGMLVPLIPQCCVCLTRSVNTVVLWKNTDVCVYALPLIMRSYW